MAQLDYYLGRAYENVEKGEQDWDWTIVLSGNAKVRNHDQTLTLPVGTLDGTTFLDVERPDLLSTVMQFGNTTINPATGEGTLNVMQTVQLTPEDYSIQDDNYTRGEEEFPERPVDPVDVLPPDPSADRAPEGPEQPQSYVEVAVEASGEVVEGTEAPEQGQTQSEGE